MCLSISLTYCFAPLQAGLSHAAKLNVYRDQMSAQEKRDELGRND
jgi:hypothetical protein